MYATYIIRTEGRRCRTPAILHHTSKKSGPVQGVGNVKLVVAPLPVQTVRPVAPDKDGSIRISGGRAVTTVSGLHVSLDQSYSLHLFRRKWNATTTKRPYIRSSNHPSC